MRALATVLVMACSALFVPSAHAGSYRDWMPIFTKAAEAYWGHGQPPACGQPTYQWVDPAVIGTDVGADELDCVIRINVNAWHVLTNPTMRCGLVFHELGHAYGHDHAEGGIMALDGPYWYAVVFRPCTRLTERWLHRYGWML